jgi:hypothetical protein
MNNEWYVNSPRDPLSWEEALNHLKRFENEWRLPTTQELKHAFDNKTEGFKDTLYWSSEEKPENNSVYFFDFYQGVISYCGTTSKLLVRLIKK